jgi:butyryl-CoA dehydrogenase
MDSRLIRRRDLNFQLFDVLDVGALLDRPRFSEHSVETLSAVLDTAYALAENDFVPHSRKSDENEPRLVGGKVQLIPEIGAAIRRFIDAGFMAATADAKWGGLQLPYTLHTAASALFSAANVGTMGYPFLTMAAANLLATFGSEQQCETFLRPMLEGRFFGTMALTEPQAGSSLSDIRTTARAAGDGSWRLTGNKIFISAGEHELSRNIVHLVLGRIEGAPAGVKGISLFIVPRFIVKPDGSLGERNDVALGGLIHKMGYRGTTSTMLNFGENGGATAYLVGEPHKGLGYMFHMMNEARIGVGTGAAALAYTGYLHALAYARERPQGRPAAAKDPTTAQVRIIGHPDVRRMLLAQKSYAEGALALCLYAARLVDEQATAPDEAARSDAHLLLEILTPVVKSWPSQWGLEANFLAIQVHGGYGYTRDYPVEQIYRDNRLNPIHEGTHGIQALDLLGRKVMLQGSAAFSLLVSRIRADLDQAETGDERAALGAMLERVESVTAQLVSAQRQGRAETVLTNATPYLEALGHLVVAWMWLRQATAAGRLLHGAPGAEESAFLDGKLQACRYFHLWELPKIGPLLDRLSAFDGLFLQTEPEWL